MAAIDPSEEPDLEAAEDKTKGRATLKLVRVPAEMLDDSEDDDDFEDIDDDEESDEEEGNGGPSDRKSKSKKLAKAEDEDDEDEDMDDDSADEAAAEALLAKIMKSEKKGKSKAVDGEVDDESDDTSDEGTGIDEVVLCTLDSEKVRLIFTLSICSQLLIICADLPTTPRCSRRRRRECFLQSLW